MTVAMFRAVRIVRRLRAAGGRRGRRLRVGARASSPRASCGSRWSSTSRTPSPGSRTSSRPGSAPASRSRSPAPRWPDATVLGNPVRASLATLVRAPDPTRPMLGVVGGSLGSPRLNDAALDLYDRWRGRVDVQVRHVAGKLHYDECRSRLDRLHRSQDTLVYELVPYEDHMDRLYGDRVARGVPGRCGHGRGARGRRGALGARAVAGRGRRPPDRQRPGDGAGRCRGAACPTPQADGARLDAVDARAAPADPDRLTTMSAAARALARPDAADRLADLVEETARARA